MIDEYNAHSKRMQTYLVVVGRRGREEDLRIHLVNMGALVWAGDCLKMLCSAYARGVYVKIWRMSILANLLFI